MKAKTITYWITTILVSFIMTVSGTLAVIHAPAMMKGLEHLGYPAYFSNILGISKLVGVCLLLAPGFGLLKEWVYTGFAIVVISAFYSHFSSGDGLLSLDPLVVFCRLETSYFTRPANRRLKLAASAGFPRMERSA